MKRSLRALIAAWACFSPAAAQAAEPVLKLERMVMLMRHGIRPPTAAQPIPRQYSPRAWPHWDVGPGLLTKHGALGIGLLADADRAYLVAAGLLPASGCPAAGQVTVQASKVPRAIDTAKAWSKSVVPGCPLKVHHPKPGAPDLMFHNLDGQPAWFNGQLAFQQALAAAPRGGLAAQVKALAPDLQRMAAILECVAPKCDLVTEPSTIDERPHGRPQLKGPLNAASTASQVFLLEYAEGKPMSEVGWGLVSREEIERLLIFNTIKFDYADRPPYIAKSSAGPLAEAIFKALSVPAGSSVTLFAGHDTNIADLGGLLGVHWHAASYPPDAIPPGSALGFELWSDGKGGQFVRLFFRSQTMDQLRNLEPLSAANPPFRQYVDMPGCGNAADARSCDLATFTRIVDGKLQ